MNTEWRMTPSVHGGTWKKGKWCCVRLRSTNCHVANPTTASRQAPMPTPSSTASARERKATPRMGAGQVDGT